MLLSSVFISQIPDTSSAQSVSINNDESLPNAIAIIYVKSGNKGILIPRMDSLVRIGIASPAKDFMQCKGYDIEEKAVKNRKS